MLGEVIPVAGGFEAGWTDEAGASHTERHRTYAQAVQHVARHQVGGLRFHDLRHSYATWLVDDGVPTRTTARHLSAHRHDPLLRKCSGNRACNDERPGGQARNEPLTRPFSGGRYWD